MEKLSNLLKAQVSTLIDTDKLVNKLESSQILPRLQELLQIAFSETTNAIQEELFLKNTQFEDEEKLRSCYETNLSLFKNKLVVLIQMMTERAFNKTVSQIQFKPKVPEPAPKKEEIKAVEKSLDISPIETIKSEAEWKLAVHEVPSKTASTPKKSNHTKKASLSSQKGFKELTYVLRPDRASPKKKTTGNKETSTQVTSTQMFSTQKDLSTLCDTELSRISMNPNMFSRGANYSMSMIQPFEKLDKDANDFYMSPSQTFLTPITPKSTSHQAPSNFLNSSVHMPQSTSRRNSALSSNSKRMSQISCIDEIVTTNSVFPASAYLRNDPSTSTLSKARKVSWIDTDTISDSPLPGDYDPNKKPGSPIYFIGKSTRGSRADNAVRTSPGLMSPQATSPNTSMSRAPKKSWIDSATRTSSPGPGMYDPKPRSHSRGQSIGRSEKSTWIDKIARTDSPGPGKYQAKSRNNSPSGSMNRDPKVPWIDSIARTNSPGPAKYYPSMHFVSK